MQMGQQVEKRMMQKMTTDMRVTERKIISQSLVGRAHINGKTFKMNNVITSQFIFQV
jgi:hypothetical protein